jgi:hypothetical protein
VRPYVKQNGVVVVPSSCGKSLHIINEPPHKVVIQIHGPADGLHGTIRLEMDTLREGLLQAGVGVRK